MKKVFAFTILFVVLLLNVKVYAAENIIQEHDNVTVKYYRITTITNNNGNSVMTLGNSNTSYTEEISEEEYNLAGGQTSVITGNVTIENSYAKLTTYITSVSSYYRYNADVEWKSIPSTRSYDTIAIGFPSNVKKLGGLYFEQTYCTTSTNCNTSTSYVYSYSSTNGVGVTFQQPNGSLYSLTHHMHFNVTKNTTLTLYAQHAYGAFAHANSSVTLTNAKKYSVNASGIVFQDGVGAYYSILGVAEATWSGTW